MTEKEFSRFTWFTPRPKAQFFITVPNQRVFNLNEKLRAQVPDYVAIGISEDGKTICLREQEDGYKLPKSGSIHDEEMVAFLVDSGVRLPAKYQVSRQEDHWLASLVRTAAPAIKGKSAPARRRRGMDSVMRELEGR